MSFRFVWRPTERVEKLPHIDLSIGSIEDIAERVVL